MICSVFTYLSWYLFSAMLKFHLVSLSHFYICLLPSLFCLHTLLLVWKLQNKHSNFLKNRFWQDMFPDVLRTIVLYCRILVIISILYEIQYLSISNFFYFPPLLFNFFPISSDVYFMYLCEFSQFFFHFSALKEFFFQFTFLNCSSSRTHPTVPYF